MERFGNRYPGRHNPEREDTVPSIVDAIPEIQRTAEGMKIKSAEIAGVQDELLNSSPDLGMVIAEIEERNSVEI